MSKIRMQSRRGMLELDVIFSRFLDHHYKHLSDEEKKSFSALLEQEDPTLYDWLISDQPCHDVTLHQIVETIKKKCGIVTR